MKPKHTWRAWTWRAALFLVTVLAWWSYVNVVVCHNAISFRTSDGEFAVSADAEMINVDIDRTAMPMWLQESAMFFDRYGVIERFEVGWWRLVILGTLFGFPFIAKLWRSLPIWGKRGKLVEPPIWWWRNALLAFAIIWFLAWLACLHGPIIPPIKQMSVWFEEGAVVMGWCKESTDPGSLFFCPLTWTTGLNTYVDLDSAPVEPSFVQYANSRGLAFDYGTNDRVIFVLGKPAMFSIVILSVLPWMIAYRIHTERKRRRKKGECAFCGYSLKGLPIPRCPECGKMNDPQTRRLLASPRWRWRLVLLAIPAMAWIVFFWLFLNCKWEIFQDFFGQQVYIHGSWLVVGDFDAMPALTDDEISALLRNDVQPYRAFVTSYQWPPGKWVAATKLWAILAVLHVCALPAWVAWRKKHALAIQEHDEPMAENFVTKNE